MRILGPVVEAFVLTVLDTRHDLSLSGHIAFSACRRSARARRLQLLAQQAFSGLLVASALHQDIERA
jgi:hypothetical protein